VTTMHGQFRMVAYRDKPGRSPHLALVRGTPTHDRETLVRVHEPLTILDLLETDRSTHSWPIHRALETIAASEAGVLVLLNCAQPGENLFAQFESLAHLEAGGEDGQRAVRRAAKVDLRTYGIGAQILKDLGVGRMRLLAQPRKMPSMTGFDLEVVGFDTTT
jgi:3,4-dihydroxy 2-butanone 4-phosphate synthase/GTP cyclohydrolase II